MVNVGNKILGFIAIIGFLILFGAHAIAGASTCKRIFKTEDTSITKTFATLEILGVTINIHNMSITYDVLGRNFVDIELSLEAVAIAIRKFNKNPLTINIVFMDRFVDEQGRAVNQHGGFLQRDGEAVLFVAMDNFMEHGFFGIQKMEPALILVLSHEAGHWGQSLRGDLLISSSSNHNYSRDPHEIEAWQVAAQNFKEFFPNVKGVLPLPEYDIHIPDKPTDTPHVTFKGELVH